MDCKGERGACHLQFVRSDSGRCILRREGTCLCEQMSTAAGYRHGTKELQEATHALGLIMGELARRTADGKKPGLLSRLRWLWSARKSITAGIDGHAELFREIKDLNEDELSGWILHLRQAAPSIFPATPEGQVYARESIAILTQILRSARVCQNVGTSTPKAEAAE